MTMDTGWVAINSYLKVRKLCGIVTIVGTSNGLHTTTANDWSILGNLSSEYLPSISIPFVANFGGDIIGASSGQIRTNGEIALYTDDAVSYWNFSVAYPV